MEELEGPWEEHFPWFEKRIRAYLAINDYTTVLMLLRGFVPRVQVRIPRECSKIAAVVFDVFEETLTKHKGFANPQKEVAVVFCGFLLYNPKGYTQRASELIRKVLEISHDGSELIARVKLRLLNVVGKAEDVDLLPVVQKLILPMEGKYEIYALPSKFEHSYIHEVELALDAKARQVAAFLTYLTSKKTAQPVA
ncbi:MAG: hypothetical protein Q8P03_00730 [bacterium]|nr:hypothetical protein [bacterium]